jgi:sterol desaturase/sphingolipid hydroxylase (fatty acid hydroxylase superfamily)
MLHYEINNSDVPIRLFKSDFLEFFTHISPITVLIIWVPVAGYFLARAVAEVAVGLNAITIPIAFIIGLIVWSFTEYMMHRFVFHFRPRNAAQERIIFLFHGVHHAQPQLKTRLVMPPILSVPLAVLFYALFTSIVGGLFNAPLWIAPMFSGVVTGYLIYDMTHYATHHFAMHAGWMKWLKRYHMMHHWKTPNERFGVSSPLWDKVFGTMPADE